MILSVQFRKYIYISLEIYIYICLPNLPKFPCIPLFLFCVVSTLNMRSILFNSEVQNTIFLTLGNMLYRKLLELLYLAKMKLCIH